jgi:hypothetical protein
MKTYIQSLLVVLSLLAMPITAVAQGGGQSLVSTASISTAGADCSTATNCAIFGVREYPSVGIYLNVATSGTFVFEATTGADTSTATWFAINDDVGGVGSATADGYISFSNPGYSYIRLRASAISGTATVVAAKGFTGLRSTASLSGAAQGDGALQDGSNPAIEGTIFDLTNSNPLAAQIVDANGDAITSFGGGVQYATADATATPTGTVALGWDGTNVIALAADAAGNLQVEFAATPTVNAAQSGVWNVTNISGTISLPTGAATEATLAGSLTTTAFQARIPANGQAVMTSSVPVVIASDQSAVPASQSGTWTVQPGNTANTTPWLASISQGGLTATVRDTGSTDSLNVAIVDASGNQLTSIGGGTEFAEDSTHSSAALGSFALTVRADTAASTASTTGEYAGFITDATGRLWSNTELMDAFAGADNVSNPTTTAVHAMNYVWDGSTWDRAAPSLVTEATHDGSLTVASTVGTLPVMVAKDFDGSALPNAVGAEADAQFLSGSLNGVLYVMPVTEDGGSTAQIRLWDGTDIASVDGSGNLAVSCSNCSGSGVSVNEDVASADAHPGTPAYAVRADSLSTTTTTDGDYQPLKSTAAGRLYTSATIDAAIAAGDNNIGNVDIVSGVVTTVSTVTSVTGYAGTTMTLGSGAIGAGSPRITIATDDPVNDALVNLDASLVAHDATDAGSTLAVGYRAIAHGTNPTAVAAADRTVGYANRAGVPFTIGGHPNIVTIEAAYTAAQTDTAIVTVSAGTKIVVTAAGFTCDAANTVDVGFRVGFGTANTPTTTGVVLTHPGVAAGSGYSRGDGNGMLGVGADDADLRITSEVPTTGSCRVLVTYYTIES